MNTINSKEERFLNVEVMNAISPKEERFLLLGCGILKKEISYIIQKNEWPVDTCFLDSALHIDLEALKYNLRKNLTQNKNSNIIVFYGECHPLIHKILKEANVYRTQGQNCIEMLIGNSLFIEELGKGAYFLLEDWVNNWKTVIDKTFGNNEILYDINSLVDNPGMDISPSDNTASDKKTYCKKINDKVISEIFKVDRKYLLCIKTPCSEDYAEEAATIARSLDIEVRWLSVDLINLESVLRDLMNYKRREFACQIL